MKRIRKTKASTWIQIVVWIIIILSVIPFVQAARYAVFQSDDFPFYNDTIRADGGNFLIKSINSTLQTWKNWQGTYSSTFLLTVLNPLHYYSYALLRLFLMGLCILFFCGVVFFTYSIMRYYGIAIENLTYVVALFLVPLLGFKEYQEVYLWWTGSMAYLLPVIFLLYGMIVLMHAKLVHSRLLYFLAGLFMFGMAGGVLEVVGSIVI